MRTLSSTNDVTGDRLISRATNEKYNAGWELWQENKRKEQEAKATELEETKNATDTESSV